MNQESFIQSSQAIPQGLAEGGYIHAKTPKFESLKAICPRNHRLCPLERYKRQCGDHTVCEGLEILDSKGIGRCY